MTITPEMIDSIALDRVKFTLTMTLKPLPDIPGVVSGEVVEEFETLDDVMARYDELVDAEQRAKDAAEHSTGPSEADIEAARTPQGGWKQSTIESWGLPWPPPPGWRGALIARARNGGDPAVVKVYRIGNAVVHEDVTIKRVMDAAYRRQTTLDNPGFCIGCGREQEGCAPDAQLYACDSCGDHLVFGAEELLIRMV